LFVVLNLVGALSIFEIRQFNSIPYSRLKIAIGKYSFYGIDYGLNTAIFQGSLLRIPLKSPLESPLENINFRRDVKHNLPSKVPFKISVLGGY